MKDVLIFTAILAMALGVESRVYYCPYLHTCKPDIHSRHECWRNDSCKPGFYCCLSSTCTTKCLRRVSSSTRQLQKQCPKPQQIKVCPIRDSYQQENCTSDKDCYSRYGGGICCPDVCGSYCHLNYENI
ncbi:uncharacterized protein [Haliotis cracherodii]|uniref:uncharacterized protein n=1 Tax=Haliotis cracherodii TaxID=6455 RepID=UPI0039ECC6EB